MNAIARRRLCDRLGLALVVVAASLLGWRMYRGHLGAPDGRLAESWHRGHRIVDRHGVLLRELPSNIGARGEPCTLEDMGDRLLIATLVSEDKRFYRHGGIDGAAIVRALGQNVRHLRIVSGASTITQQLVKLLDAGGRPPEEGRGVGDKLREAARAQNLEASLDKREILEAYVNRLSYGRNLVGPKAAAQALFGVSPKDLSWAQAALMAVLPRAPSYLDPYKHPERGRLRQRALLAALHEHGVIGAEDLERAHAEPIELHAITHPFEAAYLIESLRADELGGLAHDEPQTRLAIDLALQRDAERIVDGHARRLHEEGGAHSAAALIVDNSSGEVLAYVGGQGWSDEPGAHLDMVLAPRQPGSTLKPFIYAMAFARGLQPSDMLADVPAQFGEPGGGYAPNNFDRTFIGPVSAREALAGSLNVPAVRLTRELGGEAVLQTLRMLGMTALDRDATHYGLALALGSGEVPLWQLVEAYVALARGGNAIDLSVHPVSDPPDGMQVFPADAAAAVADALSDPLARVRGLGGTGPFLFEHDVAVKTGTSSGYRDAWTVGFTRERTVAVWVGNPDGSRMKKMTGGAGAGPVFADLMRAAMERVPQRGSLFETELLITARVCPLSGRPAGDACPVTVPRRLLRHHASGDGHAQQTHCPLHRRAHRASRPGRPPFRCDARGTKTIVTLPDVFAPWLAQQPPGAPGRDEHGFPWFAAASVDNCSDASEMARLRVDDPPHGAVLLAGGGAEVELAASMLGFESVDVEFVLDGEVVARRSAPYRAHVPASVGDHELLVRPVNATLPVRIATSRFSVR